ncbi:MAG: ATP-dependent protease ATPase subunit HslU [Clostridiales bacterium]|nr:ATP-dependent protease ATPase subunit HslU [Clostridiales bacterium]
MIQVIDSIQATPRQIVEALDKYIIGQDDAKRAVAVALRNRYRRSMLSEDMREEVTPKNIIMMGPTGVGKTEIARRLSKFVNAPFVKVEATKYTEVGYVGRDVESMIRDLVENAIRLVTKQKMEAVSDIARTAAEERVLDLILPNINRNIETVSADPNATGALTVTTREKYRNKLREGKIDSLPIEIDVEEHGGTPIGMISGMGGDEMMMQIQDVLDSMMPKKTKKKKTTVGNAFKLFEQEEAQKLIDKDDINALALEAAQYKGIIFIDEIDKIAGRGGYSNGPDVSREGVQRDILPIVEGTTVNTKYGPVKTDHILFIAAGAFHMSKISDLIPELQGRFPIRVELKSLTEEDFVKILTAPENALIKQQKALLSVEGIDLVFTDDGIREIAKISVQLNETLEDIGARRLHTVMESIVEDVSFNCEEYTGKTVVADSEYVRKILASEYKSNNLEKYIL